jgi:hypothetical protein
MLKIREVRTSSGSIAVQVIYYSNRKRVVLKHIGSAKDDGELEALKLLTVDFVNDYSVSARPTTLPKSAYDNL